MFLNNNEHMPIVSISLNDEILKQIDNLQKNLGFSGRSDAITAIAIAMPATIAIDEFLFIDNHSKRKDGKWK